MSKINFFTIGVYGYTEEEFFKIIKENNVDTFCDVRRRRAVRGSKYSFVNSKKLQRKLSELDINYIHFLELSPSNEIRNKQKEDDKTKDISKRQRQFLSEVFISAYNSEVIEKFDFHSFILKLEAIGANNVLLFCVERNPLACHRSLVTKYLSEKYSFLIKDL